MRDIVNVTIRLMAIMLIAGLCLGAAYTVTKDPIAAQKEKQAEASRKAVLADAASFEAIELTDSGNVTECYRGLDASGNAVGYAVTVNAKGFGGTVVLTVGVSDGAVTGVRVTGHSETPGLGAKAAEDAFISQFTGKSGKLLVNKTGATNEQEITAITAATITSLVNDPHAHNTFEQPDTVQPEPTKELSLANGHLTVTLAPASIHCIEIQTA